LLLSWITVPLLLFSLAQTKLGWYIALVYPPVALMLAIALAQLLTARVAFGVVAAVTLLCCIRLPTPADGSPDVKEFAPSVEQYVVHARVLYVVQPACPTPGASLTAGTMLLAKTHVRAALRFYLNRPLICIEEREVLSERPLPEGYVVSDRASWHRFAHRGRIVVDGEKYILAQWN
jgi:4-amino-4-deoxy-L-arabinose transferase-like glycosyltransferase